MQVVKEITVFLENQPGTLARITAALSDRGINIMGFTLTNSWDHGALRLVVSDAEAALHLFGEHNMLAIENDVLEVELSNAKGELSKMTESLTSQGVNVVYAYGSVGRREGHSTLYVRVSDAQQGHAILSKLPEAQ